MYAKYSKNAASNSNKPNYINTKNFKMATIIYTIIKVLNLLTCFLASSVGGSIYYYGQQSIYLLISKIFNYDNILYYVYKTNIFFCFNKILHTYKVKH